MSLFSKSVRFSLTSLLLSGLGFLIGFHWAFLSNLIEGILPQAAINRATIEDYVQKHPAEAGLIYAVIGALILPTIAGVQALFRFLRKRQSIIAMMFTEEDAVHIVASHLTRTSFEILGASGTMILPSNAPLLPSHTAMSLGVLSNYARQSFEDHKPILLHFDTDNWGAQNHSFVSVGGPFTNRIAKELLDDSLVPGFSLGDPLSIRDEADVFAAKRASDSNDAAVTTDYGALVFMKNPHDSNKRILMIFGLWPQGALAAVTTTLNPTAQKTRTLRNFVKAVRNGRSVIAIVEVGVRGLVLESGKLIKIREFAE